MSRSKVAVFEVSDDGIVQKTPLKKNRPVKREMACSISTSFLKKYVSLDKDRCTSSDIRARLLRGYTKDAIRQMLYDFLEWRLTDRFNLYMKEWREKSYDDLSLLSAQLRLMPV